jgi:hypothetical protein
MESESLSQLNFSEFNVAFLVVNAGIFKRGTIRGVQLRALRNCLLDVLIILVFNCKVKVK